MSTTASMEEWLKTMERITKNASENPKLNKEMRKRSKIESFSYRNALSELRMIKDQKKVKNKSR